MKNIVRTITVFFALLLLAAACGSGEQEAAETTASTTTTTTEAPSTTEAPPTTEAPTTTEVPDIGPVYPLTGEPLEDGNSPDHPAVVIKVSNNDATARAALQGLNEADVVFEERIEQSSTRFASVFHSVLPEEVGSVRSGRTSDVQIVANLNRPIFAFSGANDGVHGQIRRAQTDGLLVRASADFADPQFRRISDFSAPNNLVVNAAALLSKAEDGEAPLPIFDYSDNVSSLGDPSAGARVEASSPASYVWSSTDGGYLRFQGTEPHVTRDGFQITPRNVVVLTTTYVPSQIDSSSVDAITIGSGPVVIYSGGFRVEGTWTREYERDPFTFTTADDVVIGLAAGQTWVSLTPAGTSSDLSLKQADELR